MADDKKPYHQQVADEVIAALKDGTAPWIKPWEAGQQPIGPVNAVTGKPYRGMNRIRLSMAQGGNVDPRWCTYKQAQSFGGQVKRGSRGVGVQYWQFDEQQSVKDDQGRPVLGADGKPKTETLVLERPRAFFATVFHASQIENMPPLPSREEPRPEWERHQQAENLLAASNAKIFHDQVDRAYYRPATDEIHLPPRQQFSTPDKYYATTLHEVGHWSGHESRLNRDLGGSFGSESYAREELRAEIASYMLGADLGIGHDPGQHHAYIASWISSLEKDPREITRAAADAEKIQHYVMSFEQKREHKQEKQPEQKAEAQHQRQTVEAAAGEALKHIPQDQRERIMAAVSLRLDKREQQGPPPMAEPKSAVKQEIVSEKKTARDPLAGLSTTPPKQDQTLTR